jgi:hypothetical protein
MPAGTDIDRLIEMGLNRYGAGDIDGALVLWEQALAVEPENAQAISYVEYVRGNYELLTSGEPALAAEEGFAIEEEPEYQIEIVPGELGSGDPPLYMDPLDQGWLIEDRMRGAATEDDSAEHMTLELEADEPPEPEDPPGFEDATREYLGPPSRPTPPSAGRPSSDFGSDLQTTEFHHEEATGGFQHEGSSLGFSRQETEVRKRDLGFVQPSAPRPVKDAPSAPLAIGHAPTVDVKKDSGPFSTLEIEDVVPSLPTKDMAETADIPLVAKVTTKEMPETTRKPARPSSPPPRDPTTHSQAEVVLTHAPTRDLAETMQPRIEIGAPTRDLGIRPPGTLPRSPLASPDDDNEPTKQSDVRAIREAAARNDGGMHADAPRPAANETKSDIVLPFDPIDARSAEILEEVDAGAPPDEAKDDQTRRRITMLLQKAIEYTAAQDFDRAVAAADLALSEDPNSVIGQKLVTRNKDTVMHVFQNFIGDLERQPQLARPLHELGNAPISPRAAFLLSRIDGTLTIDELLDVSGMPRMEAYRHLCQLFLRGILR